MRNKWNFLQHPRFSLNITGGGGGGGGRGRNEIYFNATD